MGGNRGNRGNRSFCRFKRWRMGVSGRKIFFLPRKQKSPHWRGDGGYRGYPGYPTCFFLPKHGDFKIRDSTALARGTTHCSMKKKSYLCTQKMRYLNVLAN